MADQQSWWGRMLAAVSREYERRIRRASLVTEYGAAHGSHQHPDEDDDGAAAEILNVPRGTRRPTFSVQEAPADEHDTPHP